MNNALVLARRSCTSRRLLAACISLGAVFAAPLIASAQQTPGAEPAAQGGEGGGGTFKPKDAPQEFPGPRGTKITFPTKLYDESAVGAEQIRQASARAKAENKRVLVMLGENMCGFCVFLDDVLKNDNLVAPVVRSEFEWVKVDISKSFTKNMDIQQKYGVDFFKPLPDGKQLGGPAILIIDPEADKGLGVLGGNQMVAQPMTVTRVFDEQKIFQFLTERKAPAKPASIAMTDLQSAAKSTGRPALVLFTMPECGPCSLSESWMRRPEVAAVLAKAFTPGKIDTERMLGGKDLLEKAAGKKTALAPMFIVVDAEGKMLKPSMAVNGVPTSEGEVAEFIKSFRALSKDFNDADAETLSKALLSEIAQANQKK